MRIIEHGLDVVNIEWIKSELESKTKHRAERIDSANERTQADEPPVRTRCCASRFAGKEAVAKVLGTGSAGEITWRGIEVPCAEIGAPYCQVERRGQGFGRIVWNYGLAWELRG